MKPQQQIGHTVYRLVITRRDKSELLCFPDGPYCSLPQLDIPQSQRVAEQVNAAAKNLWNLDVYSLLTIPSGPIQGSSSPVRLQVLECIRPNGPVPPTAFWVPWSSLTDTSFRDSGNLQSIRASLVECRRPGKSQCMRPFGSAGWLRDLCEWMQEHIAPLNLRLTGQFRQLTASSTFNLIRFETNGQALWFKAVGEPNIHEFRVVSTLATLFPLFLPHIVASLPERNAWLMEEAEGTSPDTNFAEWKITSEKLAELQKQSILNTSRLLAVGCRDVSAVSLLSCVDEFFAMIDELMKHQTKTPPSILTSEQLLTVNNKLKDVLQVLSASGIPDALNHLDFNPGNILVSDRNFTLIDWAEGAVGHPFITFQYLREHFTRHNPESRRRLTELTSSYAERWDGFGSSLAISRCLYFSPLVAVFACAVSSRTWRDPARLANPETAGYFRGLARRMKREADALNNGRLGFTCA